MNSSVLSIHWHLWTLHFRLLLHCKHGYILVNTSTDCTCKSKKKISWEPGIEASSTKMPSARNEWNRNRSSKWMRPYQQEPILFHSNLNVNSIHNPMQWMKIRRQHWIVNVNEWSNHRVNYQWYNHYQRSKRRNRKPSWHRWSMWIITIGWVLVNIHHCSNW